MLKDKTFRASGAKKYQFEIATLRVGDSLHVMEDENRFWCYELVTETYQTVGYIPSSNWVSEDIRSGRVVLHSSVRSIETDDFGDYRIKIRIVTGEADDSYAEPATGPGVYSANIVGESYRQPEIARCSVGEPIRFVHDAGNPHDPRAIAVISPREEAIGFLPRGGWLTRALLDEQRSYASRIEAIHKRTAKRPFSAVVLQVKIE